jgi:hypothetical protein
VVVPVPAFTNVPVPEIVLPNVKASERLTAKVPLFTTSPTIDPLVPPLPSCSVPLAIVVPPVYELAPVKVMTPPPWTFTAPLPAMAPA